MAGEGLAPDDLVTQLLLARGVARDDIDRQRAPTLRGFVPDPSIFRDMDAAAARLADAALRREAVTVFGDYDVDGATSAATTRPLPLAIRSEEHTSELQSLMRISYAVFCLKKKKQTHQHQQKH